MKILLVERHNFGGIQFYRSTYPYSTLVRETRGAQLDYRDLKNSHLTYSDFLTADVLVIPRPYNKAHENAIINAKAVGLPVIVDLDDLMFRLPEENPAFLEWDQEHMQRLSDCLYMADAVTVSTPYMRDFLLAQEAFKGKYIEVIPNSWPKQIVRGPNEKAEKLRVLWRGSSTHAGDVATMAGQITRWSDNENIELIFMGHVFAYKWKCMKIKKLPLADYFKAIQSLRPHVVIAPLENNDFNRAKSNIAWIEGTMAGAVTFTNMPAIDQWGEPGMLRDPSVIGSDRFWKMQKGLYSRSREAINSNYQLQEYNKVRARIISKISKRTRLI